MGCYYCGKQTVLGHSHTHHRGVAGGRWKKRAPKTTKIFRVNLQVVRIVENGQAKRVKICTKCLKRVKKDLRDGKKPFLTIPSLEKKYSLQARGSSSPVSVS